MKPKLSNYHDNHKIKAKHMNNSARLSLVGGVINAHVKHSSGAELGFVDCKL